MSGIRRRWLFYAFKVLALTAGLPSLDREFQNHYCE